MEQWKDIIIEKNGIIYDYTGKYQVSNLGRVRNAKGRIMKPTMLRTGYKLVLLCKNGKHEGFTVHRLVATAFIENPNNLPIVNHKDENKINNHVDNLEWCTSEYNLNYGTRIERVSELTKGEKHYFYGKHHTEETKRKQSEAKKGKYTGDKHPRAKKVMCIETGQVFGTLKEANQWIIKGDIGACLKGKTKTAGGYHWKYVVEEGETQS